MSEYNIYIDESGDPGIGKIGESRHYILTGIIFPKEQECDINNRFTLIKSKLNTEYPQIGMDYEFHGIDIIRGYKEFKLIKARERVQFLTKSLILFTHLFTEIKILNTVCIKQSPITQAPLTKNNIVEWTWSSLMQMFNNYLEFNKPTPDHGYIVSDDTYEDDINAIWIKRKLKNIIKCHSGEVLNHPITQIQCVPMYTSSKMNPLVQLADLVALALYLKIFPKGHLRHDNAHSLFDIVDKNLLKVASKKCKWNQGIKWI